MASHLASQLRQQCCQELCRELHLHQHLPRKETTKSYVPTQSRQTIPNLFPRESPWTRRTPKATFRTKPVALAHLESQYPSMWVQQQQSRRLDCHYSAPGPGPILDLGYFPQRHGSQQHHVYPSSSATTYSSIPCHGTHLHLCQSQWEGRPQIHSMHRIPIAGNHQRFLGP